MLSVMNQQPQEDNRLGEPVHGRIQKGPEAALPARQPSQSAIQGIEGSSYGEQYTADLQVTCGQYISHPHSENEAYHRQKIG